MEVEIFLLQNVEKSTLGEKKFYYKDYLRGLNWKINPSDKRLIIVKYFA